jgi:hypothetical protein
MKWLDFELPFLRGFEENTSEKHHFRPNGSGSRTFESAHEPADNGMEVKASRMKEERMDSQLTSALQKGYLRERADFAMPMGSSI